MTEEYDPVPVMATRLALLTIEENLRATTRKVKTTLTCLLFLFLQPLENLRHPCPAAPRWGASAARLLNLPESSNSW